MEKDSKAQQRPVSSDLEERYRRIVETANEGIWEIDKDARTVFVNQRMADMLGYTVDEMMGCSVFQFLFPEDRPEGEKRLESAKQGESLRSSEFRYRRKDGSVLWAIASRTPKLDEQGNFLGSFGMLSDLTERKKAEEAIQELNLQLENRVHKRTTALQEEIAERIQAEEALKQSHERLQELSRRLVEVQEEELRTIARELHDRVGQILSALRLNLTLMEDSSPQNSSKGDDARLQDSLNLVDETIKLVRNLLNELRPAVLDDFGLRAALQSYIEEFTPRYNIPVVLEMATDPDPRLNPSLEITLLRIVQEALTNVARHAQAHQATVSLRLENETVYLAVLDDGIGIEASKKEVHDVSHGQKIMRERAEAFGGTVNIGSPEGKGTKVEVTIPIASSSIASQKAVLVDRRVIAK